MTTGKRIRTRRKELGMSVVELSQMVGKNPATIYRYESDAIEMPASMLKPLADALDINPNELMEWGKLPYNEAERQDKMCEILPLIADGISVEGRTLKYVLLKMPTYGGDLEADLRAVLLILYQLNQSRQYTKMRALRILWELAAPLDIKSQEKLISYAEFLDFQRQKKLSQRSCQHES